MTDMDITVEALAAAMRQYRTGTMTPPDEFDIKDAAAILALAARSTGSGSRVEAWHGPGEAPHTYWPDWQAMGDCRVCGHVQEDHGLPTPPPAVDGTRCAECGGVKDDVFHVPCLVGGPFHYVKTCHPFTPPTPAPDTRLRALEAVREAAAMFLAAEDDWRVLDIHDDDEDRILASDHLSETRRALRALLAPDGEGSRS